MRIVEFDCDGVLFDMSKAVVTSKYGSLLRQNNLTFENAVDYSFSNFTPEMRNDIYKAFSDVSVMELLEPYTGIPAMLSKLYLQTLQKNDIAYVLRSGITCEDIRAVKQHKIEELLGASVGCLNPKFSIELELMDNTYIKSEQAPFILVEDMPDNLIKSGAEYKILVNHGYNSEVSYPILKQTEYIRVNNATEMLNAVLSILNAHLR